MATDSFMITLQNSVVGQTVVVECGYGSGGANMRFPDQDPNTTAKSMSAYLVDFRGELPSSCGGTGRPSSTPDGRGKSDAFLAMLEATTMYVLGEWDRPYAMREWTINAISSSVVSR